MFKKGGTPESCSGPEPPIPTLSSMLKKPYVKSAFKGMNREAKKQILQLLRDQIENDLKTADRMIART